LNHGEAVPSSSMKPSYGSEIEGDIHDLNLKRGPQLRLGARRKVSPGVVGSNWMRPYLEFTWSILSTSSVEAFRGQR
jgi:hypothetical protein